MNKSINKILIKKFNNPWRFVWIRNFFAKCLKPSWAPDVWEKQYFYFLRHLRSDWKNKIKISNSSSGQQWTGPNAKGSRNTAWDRICTLAYRIGFHIVWPRDFFLRRLQIILSLPMFNCNRSSTAHSREGSLPVSQQLILNSFKCQLTSGRFS